MKSDAQTEVRRITLRVIGRVQGVGFRCFIEEQARLLPVSGRVCNCHDGSVLIVAEGSRAALESLREAAERGPSTAAVTSVNVEWGASQGMPPGFVIGPTEAA